MKRQKSRVTANQIDQALYEQIRHAQGMNIPSNAVSSAATFCCLVIKRLFEDHKLSEPLNSTMIEVIRKAKEERALAEIAAQQESRAKEHGLILPGQPGFNRYKQ
jgi:hypothetical protein